MWVLCQACMSPYLYDYGCRIGLGVAPFDFFAGYRVNAESAYVGIALYFGRK